jgi:hypothetical protein
MRHVLLSLTQPSCHLFWIWPDVVFQLTLFNHSFIGTAWHSLAFFSTVGQRHVRALQFSALSLVWSPLSIGLVARSFGRNYAQGVLLSILAFLPGDLLFVQIGIGKSAGWVRRLMSANVLLCWCFVLEAAPVLGSSSPLLLSLCLFQ